VYEILLISKKEQEKDLAGPLKTFMVFNNPDLSAITDQKCCTRHRHIDQNSGSGQLSV
jgi:hypothetical protein